MLSVLARNWGLVALRGVAGIVFGLLTLFNPAVTLTVLVLLFGGYSLVDGVFTAVAAVLHRQAEPSWPSLLVSGIVGVAIGVVTFGWPDVTALALLLVIAAWAIAIGLGEIVAAIRLRQLIRGEWILMLAGVLSVLFGVALFLFPGRGAVAIVLWIGAFATVEGILRVALTFRLRRWLQVQRV